MRPRYAPRHLGRDARRIQLRKAWSFEAARLRAAAEPATPEPLDDEPATVAVPYQSIAEASREAHARLFPVETTNVQEAA